MSRMAWPPGGAATGVDVVAAAALRARAAPCGTVWDRLAALVDWEAGPRAAMRVGLEPERDLLARLGDPHRRWRCVHVTGTKGKGSVCALVEAGLLHAGLRAGRYGSPHLEHLGERVSHGGRPLGDAALGRALERALAARDEAVREGTAARHATWFDVVTAAAFWSFAEARLDWVAVEVGLGGRDDSTNVVTPELSVITNVGLEHTEVLGSTVEAIARHKAGIVKPGRPVVTSLPADGAAGRVVAERARAVGSAVVSVDLAGTSGITAANVALARAALEGLGRRGGASARRKAALGAADLPDEVASACALPGRLELRSLTAAEQGAARQVVLDGAHVGFAITGVLDELQARWPRGRPVVVVALAADKNADDFIARLAGRASFVVCTELADGRRSWPCAALGALCAAHGVPHGHAPDAEQALEQALAVAQRGDWVLVTGSLHLIGPLRPRLARRSSIGKP